MKKAEINAMLDILDECARAYGLNCELGYESAMFVDDGVSAIKRALEAVGVSADVINSHFDDSFSQGITDAHEMIC